MDKWDFEKWLVFAKEQAAFFYGLILENLPQSIVDDINKNKLSICDFGCSLGDGVDMVSNYFRDSKIMGIDNEQWRIDKAKELYPNRDYICDDIRNINSKFDVVLSSNALEHFERPIDAIRDILIEHAGKYMVFLVPFQEYERCEGHLYTFETGSFPSKIDDFVLIYTKEIDCTALGKSHCWSGKQLLAIYAKENIKENFEKESKNEFLELDKKALKLNKEIQRLTSEIEFLNSQLNMVYSGNLWKTAKIYYRMRDKIRRQN